MDLDIYREDCYFAAEIDAKTWTVSSLKVFVSVLNNEVEITKSLTSEVLQECYASVRKYIEENQHELTHLDPMDLSKASKEACYE